MSSLETSSTPSAEFRFFIFDALDGQFVYFKSAEDRDAGKDGIIQQYLDDGWSEEVEQVVAGEVTHTCEKINVEHRPADLELDDEGCDSAGTYWGDDFAYRCNYDLLPLVPEAEQAMTRPGVGWLWTMHQEFEQKDQMVSLNDDSANPFGVPDRDFSACYPITRARLFAGAEETIHSGESE